jgi:Endosomal/lysosomal potassium channel TMEM175
MSLLPERRHEVSRVEAFSDAVFAFALTLLVVSLDVPNSYDELAKLMAGFAPFACSFTLLTWIWYEHNIFFRRYGMQDGLVVAVNAALLFVVLFYVYPLKFLFTSAFSFLIPALRMPGPQLTSRELGRIFAIYGAGFVALFLIFGLLYLLAYRSRHTLGLSPVEVFDVKAAAGAHMVSVGVGLAAIVVALLAPGYTTGMSGFTYFLMWPAHAVYGSRVRRQRKALLTTDD